MSGDLYKVPAFEEFTFERFTYFFLAYSALYQSTWFSYEFPSMSVFSKMHRNKIKLKKHPQRLKEQETDRWIGCCDCRDVDTTPVCGVVKMRAEHKSCFTSFTLTYDHEFWVVTEKIRLWLKQRKWAL